MTRMRARSHSATLVAAILVLGAANALWAGETGRAGEAYHSEQDVLEILRPILVAAKSVGRINYGAVGCQYVADDPVPFPQVRLSLPSRELTGLAAVRNMFRSDDRVLISEAKPGLIAITLGAVSEDFLRTRIAHLELTPFAQYNGIDAVEAIVHNIDVQAAMNRLKIHRPLQLIDHLIQEPDPELPHLPSSMSDVTVNEALDSVARTFGGIVIYGDCTQEHLFVVEFVPANRR